MHYKNVIVHKLYVQIQYKKHFLFNQTNGESAPKKLQHYQTKIIYAKMQKHVSFRHIRR